MAVCPSGDCLANHLVLVATGRHTRPGRSPRRLRQALTLQPVSPCARGWSSTRAPRRRAPALQDCHLRYQRFMIKPTHGSTCSLGLFSPRLYSQESRGGAIYLSPGVASLTHRPLRLYSRYTPPPRFVVLFAPQRRHRPIASTVPGRQPARIGSSTHLLFSQTRLFSCVFRSTRLA